MSTTFVLLPFVVAAMLTLIDATDVGVATCAVVVCIADSADWLPGGRRSRSIVAKLVAVEVSCVAEVLPYRLRGDAAFRATS